MAHKKAGGSSRNGRDSQGRRGGIKKFGSEKVKTGEIIVRQVGSSFHPGKNVKEGRDYTLYSIINGYVKFHYGKNNRRYISVVEKQLN
jgi:large subunit ribosomal protein L27